MLAYIARRILVMIPTLFVISVVSFVIIQLPPGDFLTTMVNEQTSRGEGADMARVQYLRDLYGLDMDAAE